MVSDCGNTRKAYEVGHISTMRTAFRTSYLCPTFGLKIPCHESRKHAPFAYHLNGNPAEETIPIVS